MTADQQEATSLEELLDQVEEAAEGRDVVSIETMLRVIGRRSFGPLLLLAGLFTLAPLIGDIPGVPTIIGIFVFLISVQLLLRRKQVWLPGWLLRRSVSAEKATKAAHWMRRPAEYVGRFLRPRLTVLIDGPALLVIAAAALLIAAMMPPMEFVPFSANAAGGALTALGLALIFRDGLLALIAIGITFGAIALVAYHMF